MCARKPKFEIANGKIHTYPDLDHTVGTYFADSNEIGSCHCQTYGRTEFPF